MSSIHGNNSSFCNPFISNHNFLSMSKAPEFTPKIQQADSNNKGEEDFSSFAQVLEEAAAGEEERIRQHLASRKF